MERDVVVSSRLASMGVSVAFARVDGVSVGSSPSLSQLLREESVRARERFKGSSDLLSNEIIVAYRRFLWSLKIDPTKVRPSSEALLRRIINGREIPSINNVVDAGNLASIRTLVSIGLYDLDRVKTPLMLKLSEGGEVFDPIGGKTQVLRPGLPIMVDVDGRVIHVYPHRDSKIAMIRDDTRRVLVVAAGAPGIPRHTLKTAVLETINYIKLASPGISYTEVMYSP